MSHSQSKELDLFDPFTEPKPTLFNRFGNKLGSVFVSAKRKATEKYLEVTQGINQRIEQEDERIQAEIFHHLEAQAEEFEAELSQQRKRWFTLSLILTLLAFFGGIASAIFYLTTH